MRLKSKNAAVNRFINMIEPIWHPLHGKLTPETPEYMKRRDEALLWRATNLAIESALRFGADLPVGAVAAEGDLIAGRYFASDRRFGGPHTEKHAEVMAILDTKFNWLQQPDTVVVTIEPCDNCQDFLAAQPGLKRVGFGLSREEVAEKGLVKPHGESIFERVRRLGYGFEPVLIEDEELRRAGSLILDFAKRDVRSGAVTVDAPGLREAIKALNAA